MRTLIQGGYVVSYSGQEHEIIPQGVVVYEGNTILQVGQSYQGPVDATIEARGKLVSPGFINTHVHARSNATDHLLNDVDRPDFLARNYLSGQAALQGRAIPRHPKEDVAVAGKFALLQALKCGATTILEIGTVGGSPDEFVQMASELGVRAYLSPAFRSADFYSDAEGRIHYAWNEEEGFARLKRAIAFIEKYDGSHNGRIRGMLYPGQADTCSLELLRECKAAAKSLGVGIQLHAAMNILEFHEFLRRHRRTPIQTLAEIGFLGPEVTLAHCIYLGGYDTLAYPYADDLRLLAQSGTAVSHCPLKYAKFGVIMKSFDRYLRAGVPMTLGTDTWPRDIISEMRYAALFSRIAEGNFLVGLPRDVFNAATVMAANVLGRPDLGRLAPGAKADIVIINLGDLYMGGVLDPIKTLVECGSGKDVDTVIVDGRTIVSGGRAVEVDEERLLFEVQRLCQLQWAEVPTWDFAGRSPLEIVPPAFQIRERQRV